MAFLFLLNSRNIAIVECLMVTWLKSMDVHNYQK